MSSSGKIRVPAEEYVIYFPPTDQSDSRITLNCSINKYRLDDRFEVSTGFRSPRKPMF